MGAVEAQIRDPRSGRGVLTMAYGETRFHEMAKSLGRSIRAHSPDTKCAIITEFSDAETRAIFDICIPYNATFGFGNRQKLHLDLYTPFRETLFIDSDCLVVKDLETVWGFFERVPFGIPGDDTARLKQGDKDKKITDVDFILHEYGLPEVAKFNSGLVYFDSSEEAFAIFQTVRELLPKYRELRFARPEKPYDEPVFALAMAIHGVPLVLDGGATMRTPAGAVGRVKVDVLRGIGEFKKYGLSVKPAIVHFAGWASRSYVYRRECLKLRRWHRGEGAHLSAMTLFGVFVVSKRYTVLRSAKKVWGWIRKRMRLR